MNRFPHHLLPACLVVLAIPSSQVAAESHAVCEAYANDAVQAFHASRQHNCGWSNARWHDNRQAHYDWCRGAPADWVANEATFRASNLRVCRREPGAETCHEYASIAVSSQRSNLGGNCGFTGARWGDSYDHHLAWCMTVPSDVAAREANIRNAMLGVCGGDDRFRRCDAYARDAENQVREAARLNCQFSGPRWTPLYEDHLAWCVSQPAEVAAQESRERDGPLSQCRTQLPHGPTPEACNWTAHVTTDACTNGDGSPATGMAGSGTACGATEEIATERAKASLPMPPSEDDPPPPGTCTYNVDARPGCGCG